MDKARLTIHLCGLLLRISCFALRFFEKEGCGEGCKRTPGLRHATGMST